MFSKKILIIDDEIDSCHLLKTYLTDMNYEVHLAHTLASGLALLKEVTPDVMFIDNNLPDGLGWEQLKFLIVQFPNCKINMISAYQNAPKDLFPGNNNISVIEKPLRLNMLKEYL
jgi:DNA-binding NtrC family response regulator